MTDTPALPVGTLREALPILRRPFTPEAVRFKIQTAFKGQDGKATGALIVSYIDARLVIERLNAVCGSEWSANYSPTENPKLLWCHLTVGDTTRSDVGESTKGMSKDLVSDSLKRAAVHFGVGVSLYALKQITLNVGPHLKVNRKGEPVLTDAGMAALRKGYAGWLESTGTEKYGSVYDHGDVADATGLEVEATQPTDPEPSVPQQSAAEQAAELRAKVKKAA